MISDRIEGYATPAGTARYRDRFPQMKAARHFRQSAHVPKVKELWLSSIGIGTYLGEADDESDRAYTDAIALAARSGINVLDTAINYRNQRSERNVGAALKFLIEKGELARDEVLVCTKAGYLPFDGDMPRDPSAYLRQEYVASGVAPMEEIAGGMHCMAPGYLADQLERSRRNTGLETLDVFYLHNPETQLGHVAPELFRQRLRRAFEFLEGAVRDRKIRWYGAATWGGFRVSPTDRSHLSLEQFVETAREVAGDGHHFRFAQLPFNLSMLEAYAYGNQMRAGEAGSLLKQAAEFGIAVIASGTLYQGNLAQGLPSQLKQALGADEDATAAIQFVRSATNLTTALVGMGRKEHVESNLKIATIPPLEREKWEGLFSSG
jgi:aryl-alcohol dehydrogenase-like predicted oxidoreductase